jgi:hypothetical protein
MAWRSGMLIAVIGILPTLLLYALIAHLQSLGESAAAIAMPDMYMKNMAIFWAFPTFTSAAELLQGHSLRTCGNQCSRNSRYPGHRFDWTIRIHSDGLMRG